MLRIIDEEATIARHQKQFIRRFRPFMAEKISVKIGHQGASFAAKVAWSDELGIWMVSPKSEEKRYWHIFGRGKPAPGNHPPIACEINFPLAGIDRKIGAAFAEDHRGRIFVIHRGKIGGGQKGIGKALFESRYRGVWAGMEDGGEAITVAVAGELHSPRFALQIAQFVHKIAWIKERAADAASPQLAMSFDMCRFAGELTGEPYADSVPDLSGPCDDSLVVSDLAAVLRDYGRRIGNDAERDLFVLGSGGGMDILFKINTDTSRKNTLADMASLILGGGNLPQPCRLILAVAEPPEPSLANRLKDLRIETLLYTWEKGHAVFPGLEHLIAP